MRAAHRDAFEPVYLHASFGSPPLLHATNLPGRFDTLTRARWLRPVSSSGGAIEIHLRRHWREVCRIMRIAPIVTDDSGIVTGVMDELVTARLGL